MFFPFLHSQAFFPCPDSKTHAKTPASTNPHPTTLKDRNLMSPKNIFKIILPVYQHIVKYFHFFFIKTRILQNLEIYIDGGRI
jgi:hypothetical protein